MMEDSHFNSSYFWSPIPTVQGQIENAMFLNKMKEQEKNPSFQASSTSHYQTTVLIPGPKQEGGGQGGGGHLLPPHSTQNITVVPVSSTGIMTAAGLVITTPQGTLVSPASSSQSFVPGHPATTMIVSALHAPNTDKKEDGLPHLVVMPTPSKRGRKKKTALQRAGLGAGHALSAGNETLILAHLAAGGQVMSLQHHATDPYDLSNEDEDHGGKDTNKTYRNHTEAKPHKCPHCTKSFANSSYLAQHIRIHTGVKPYTCSFCQKCFRQLSHLQQHNRIHTGDRPYKCVHPGCEKSFTQLSNLQSHRRQHNKDKPYKCSNCNRGYTDAASLEVHLSTHTVKHAKLYSCGLCNRTYTSETYLVKHMQKHNPDQLTAAAVAAAQQAQSHQNQNQNHSGAQGLGEGTDGGGSRPGGGGQGQNQGSYTQAETVGCPFDLHQYKTVAAGDIQYKTVSVADLVSHKDLCLTVATSTIQVEHLNS
ncbi:zinc finger protein 384b isoform X3 [Osmerus eperlanus]|uniref:zinc finger protein 384b isoform X3 n=1 Tax=Osmerus eperlanus TaxID=29151 RepID=UPI002E0F286C